MNTKLGAINQLRWDINRTLVEIQARYKNLTIADDILNGADFMILIREEVSGY